MSGVYVEDTFPALAKPTDSLLSRAPVSLSSAGYYAKSADATVCSSHRVSGDTSGLVGIDKFVELIAR